MNPHIRAEFTLNNQSEVLNFISVMTKVDDRFIVEDKSGNERVNARSILGLLYASTEFDKMYLVNETHNGTFPAAFDTFRC